MELKKDVWTKSDGEEFQTLLVSLGRPEKVEWTTRIINTKMPVLAILSPEIGKLVKAIARGNFLSFLDLNLWEYFENTSVNGSLICRIKDFETMKKYLLVYGEKADNWATCDLLSFSIKGREEDYLALCKEYVGHPKPFVRRIGISILFKLIDDTHIDDILEIMDGFYEETEYYVNMINAWLLAECFSKQREKTLAYLEKNHLNDFTVNKGVQKCRDSYRISDEDKQMLLKFKR